MVHSKLPKADKFNKDFKQSNDEIAFSPEVLAAAVRRSIIVG